mmetsp:Transcript_39545/g.61674  ORF Transcript_39545/g.61674 Transcript_39545/m.61674 type:complete len:188 (+) Transcript_39545:627-1190(+)
MAYPKQATAELLQKQDDSFQIEERGPIEVKGYGQIHTAWINGLSARTSSCRESNDQENPEGYNGQHGFCGNFARPSSQGGQNPSCGDCGTPGDVILQIPAAPEAARRGIQSWAPEVPSGVTNGLLQSLSSGVSAAPGIPQAPVITDLPEGRESWQSGTSQGTQTTPNLSEPSQRDSFEVESAELVPV